MATLGMDLAQLRAGGILVQVLLMAYVDTAYACSWGVGALGHALAHWGMHWGIGALSHALGHALGIGHPTPTPTPNPNPNP